MVEKVDAYLYPLQTSAFDYAKTSYPSKTACVGRLEGLCWPGDAQMP